MPFSCLQALKNNWVASQGFIKCEKEVFVMDNENQDVEVEKTNEEVENQDNAGKVEEDKAAKTKRRI